MFTRINDFLEFFFSIRINKVTKKRVKPIIKDSIGSIYVEFFGLPGVGKTYTFNRLDFKRNKWLTISEYKKINTEMQNRKTEYYSFYDAIISYKLNSIVNREYTSYDKLSVLSFFKRIIDDDLSLNNIENTILSEEGLLHNFGNEILRFFQENRENLSALFKKRAFIYCYSTPEIIADQILRREKETKKILPQHKNKTFEELVEAQKIGLENQYKIVELLKDNGIPILEINTINITENEKLIEAFILENHIK